jgi:hypothetical protein
MRFGLILGVLLRRLLIGAFFLAAFGSGSNAQFSPAGCPAKFTATYFDPGLQLWFYGTSTILAGNVDGVKRKRGLSIYP